MKQSNRCPDESVEMAGVRGDLFRQGLVCVLNMRSPIVFPKLPLVLDPWSSRDRYMPMLNVLLQAWGNAALLSKLVFNTDEPQGRHRDPR